MVPDASGTPTSGEPPDRPEADPGGVASWEPGGPAPQPSDPPPEPAPAAPDAPASGEPLSERSESDLAPARRPPAMRIFAIVISVLIVLCLGWIGGELHYQSCLDKTATKTQGATDNLTRLVRVSEVKKCSRSPF